MKHPPCPSRQIGDFLVTALSDGNMAASLDLLSGIATAEAAVIQRRAGIADPGNIHIHCYLLRGRGRTVLVDTGTGGGNGAGGELPERLEAVGIDPDEVDTVLLTHAHPDHIGGLLDRQGKPVFRRAALYLHAHEAAYWRDEEKQKIASDRSKPHFTRVQRTLDAYGANLHLIRGGPITEGITAVWLPGHTPGHTGFRIDSDSQSLLIWGDIVHFPHIQSAHPAVSVVFDCDPAQAEVTRKQVLEQAVRENLLIAGMHLQLGGFATVVTAEQGYRLCYPTDPT